MKKIVLIFTICLVAFGFVSCDKDFNSMGTDIIGDEHYDFDKYVVENLKAYSKATGPVQTNNLPINSLGVFQDPFFGSAKSHFVSQLELAVVNPDFGLDVEIKNTDSVYLYVPYFSTKTATVSDNTANTYKLDSIYGDLATSFNLKVFESGYYIRNFDATNPSVSQKYFSDEKALVENNLIGSQLNNSTNIEENEAFKFSKEELVIYKTDGAGNYVNNKGELLTDASERVVKERIKPGMWINLDKNFFLTKILQATSSNLINNNNFKEYFKGLYFQVTENIGQNGALAQLNFADAYIIVQYHSKASVDDPLKKKAVRLNLKGNTINFLENNLSPSYQNAITASNPSTGDELIYIKGGEGSVVFIDLFGQDLDNNGVADELEMLRNNKWLINDAVLTFYIKNENQIEPKRIFLYDVDNNVPLLDYFQDNTTASDFKSNKYIHGGILEKQSTTLGIRYRVKLRAHIDKILNSTNTNSLKNVRLGLVVTENINNFSTASLKTTIQNTVEIPVGSPNQTVSFLPRASIMNPLGTILYGTNVSPMDENKKLKLEIYYTKPN